MESSQIVNGRLNLLNNSGTALFLQDKIKVDDRTNYTNAMKYTLENSRLSDAFFSYENRTILQNTIRAEVYKLSNNTHIIDRQDPDQLFIIMKGIYLQYSNHLDTNIREQIKVLNQMVINYAVPRIYTELLTYLKYKVDASTLVVPLENPSYYHKDTTVEMNRFI
jgi:Family of unknown function (DUF5761)